MVVLKHKSIGFGQFNNKNLNKDIWLSVSEAANLGGVQNKTIRRAIQSNIIKYKIINNRYVVNLTSVLEYLHNKTKLKNKLDQFGLGQYVDKWRSSK
ncbi:MAG: helix-turn-helix domain-containing protein [Patescibacteria group bacterium]|nr:helix-turn-helix domain-containing protein [Patescibacteria group bacterium]MBU1870581.1 helix-turn-helix domain-containing protein [Patescibacteria group bacterium]